MSLEQILKEKHHVVVQLNKEFSPDAGRYKLPLGPIKKRKSEPFFGQDYNILVINHHSNSNNNINNNNNNNTNNTNTNSLRLNFDCVCNGFDGHARYEIDTMIEQLLGQQQNCCMIRCTIYKENSTALLNYILLTEITKHLQRNHFVMREINCEYYDVRKFNVVNMFSNEFRSLKRFQNSLDLHKWLNTEYQQLTIGCQGNECLDLQFVVTDRLQRPFTVKFSYMHIILSKLDLESKTALINCFLSVSKHYAPRDGHNSLLVDTIRDYLGKNNQMRLWLFLSLPVKRPINDLMDDMIKIACAASEGFTLKQTMSTNQSFLLYEELSLKNLLTNDIKAGKSDNLNVNDFGQTKAEAIVKSASKASTNNENNNNNNNINNNNNNNNNNHINNNNNNTDNKNSDLKGYAKRVHVWYDKINHQYNNVLRALESYYDKKYEIRAQQLCTHIHDIINHDELGLNQVERLFPRVITTKVGTNGTIAQTTKTTGITGLSETTGTMGPPILPKKVPSHLNSELNRTISDWSLKVLNNLLMEYHEAAGDFRLMIDEIGKTNYESLKAYLRTKTYALRRFSLEHKLKKLRDIQHEIQQTINEENELLLKNLRSNF